jgi:hypothetical protein
VIIGAIRSCSPKRHIQAPVIVEGVVVVVVVVMILKFLLMTGAFDAFLL